MKEEKIFQAIHEIDDKFIEEAAGSTSEERTDSMKTERKSFWKKFFLSSENKLQRGKAAAALAACVVLATGTVAAASSLPSLTGYIQSIFTSKEKTTKKKNVPQVKKKEVSLIKLNISQDQWENLIMEDGYFVQWEDEDNTRVKNVYERKGDTLVSCEKRVCQLNMSVLGESIVFPLKYARIGNRVCQYPDSNTDHWEVYLENGLVADGRAVVWINNFVSKTGQRLTTGYYLDLETGKTEPVLDTAERDKALEQVKKGKYSSKTVVNEMIPEKVSEDGRFILYRGDLDEIIAGKKLSDKPGWHVFDVKTRKNMCLKETTEYLHASDFTFVDDTHLGVAYLGDTAEEKQVETEPGVYEIQQSYEAGLYDLTTGELKRFGTKDVAEDGSLLSVESKTGGYRVKDIVSGKVYNIPVDKKWQTACIGKSRNLVCLISEEGHCKTLWLKENKVVDFSDKEFSDVEEIQCVSEWKEDSYVLEGVEKDGGKVCFVMDMD